jgi:aldehyde dehydrogenase (NAD+)
MYAQTGTGSDDMGKIIAEFHCDRLKELIETSKGKIITGGKVNKVSKFVEPTIIDNPDLNSRVMTEEIFGPILPIIVFKTIDEAINFINKKDKALVVYYFGKAWNNPNRDRLMNETSSGGFSVNEVMMTMINHNFGFGGVGASGYGRYAGYEGFKQFSNAKSILIRPTLNFKPFNQIGPPYTAVKQAKIRGLLKMEGN